MLASANTLAEIEDREKKIIYFLPRVPRVAKFFHASCCRKKRATCTEFFIGKTAGSGITPFQVKSDEIS